MARQQYRGLAAQRYDRRWAVFTARMQAPIIDLALSQQRPGLRVLDVGCGTGTLLAALARREPEIALIGMDASPDMFAQARTKLGKRAQFFEVDLNQPLPEVVREEWRVDLLLCSSVLHYLRQPVTTVRALTGLLAPGGCMILADFTRHGWWWPGFEMVLRLADAQHYRTLASADLAALLRAAGLHRVAQQTVRAGGPWRGTIVAGKRDGE